MKITIKEVAERAGVSIATVSRVLNNTGIVQQKTRESIMLAAKELQYVPNASARNLSRSKTDTIGLLLPDLHGAFYSEVIRGVDKTAQQSHHHLIVSSSHNKKNEIEAALRLMRGRVDGLIIMSPQIDANTLHANIPRSMPVVLLNCFVEGSSFDSINIDNFRGAYDMVRHLLQHGHRRIAIITGTPSNYDADQRLYGYRRAMMEAGLTGDDLIEVPGDFTEEEGYAAGKKIISMQPRPTAIFASNDSMAIGAMSALREAGLKVPADIAMAGFDDIPISKFIRPALSSVHVSISELGEHAMQRLLMAIEKKNNYVKQHTALQATVVIRESCGAHG
ncbi:MAG TPA: LacI family DNA-binding transcriptional regulator [Bacteroidota bacterium]|nr:LacI family DNA-binding transcriptional regulator [Bacteroidota bacterium]